MEVFPRSSVPSELLIEAALCWLPSIPSITQLNSGQSSRYLMSFILQSHCSTASLFVFLSLSSSTAESPFCTSAESLRSSRGNSCLCRLFLSTFAFKGRRLCSFQTLYLITYLDETLHSIWRSHSLIKHVLTSDQEPGYCVWCWGVAFCQVCSHSPKQDTDAGVLMCVCLPAAGLHSCFSSWRRRPS